MALLGVTTLCFLVHTAPEWRIRKRLEAHDLAFPEQKGGATHQPTVRWIFRNSHGIQLVLDRIREVVLNMKEQHVRILTISRDRCGELYDNRPR